LLSFAGTNGANPWGALVQGSDSNLYGTTVNGGVYGLGTAFEITPAGGFTLLASFSGTNGSGP
jgi:uncharacterized repeat protein (TIGR03803 family)